MKRKIFSLVVALMMLLGSLQLTALAEDAVTDTTTLDAYAQLLNYDNYDSSDTTLNYSTSNAGFGDGGNGKYVKWSNVDFGSNGIKTAAITLATNQTNVAGAFFEIWADATTEADGGTLVGIVPTTHTGGWSGSAYKAVDAYILNNITGVHSVYAVHRQNASAGNLQSLSFTSLDAPFTPDESAESAYGATFYPGDADAVSGFAVINAGGSVTGCTPRADGQTSGRTNGFVMFKNVDFGDKGLKEFKFTAGADGSTYACNFNLVIDSWNGTTVATGPMVTTNAWAGGETVATATTPITGVHDIYIFREGAAGDFYSFSFTEREEAVDTSSLSAEAEIDVAEYAEAVNDFTLVDAANSLVFLNNTYTMNGWSSTTKTINSSGVKSACYIPSAAGATLKIPSVNFDVGGYNSFIYAYNTLTESGYKVYADSVADENLITEAVTYVASNNNEGVTTRAALNELGKALTGKHDIYIVANDINAGTLVTVGFSTLAGLDDTSDYSNRNATTGDILMASADSYNKFTLKKAPVNDVTLDSVAVSTMNSGGAGSYVIFKDVYVGAYGFDSLTFKNAISAANQPVYEVRLGDSTGTLLGSFTFTSGKGWGVIAEQTADMPSGKYIPSLVENFEGYVDLCILCTSGSTGNTYGFNVTPRETLFETVDPTKTIRYDEATETVGMIDYTNAEGDYQAEAVAADSEAESSYLKYEMVDFGEGLNIDKIAMTLIPDASSGTISFVLDNPAGTPFATFDCTGITDEEAESGKTEFEITDVASVITGTHDLYVVFSKDCGVLFTDFIFLEAVPFAGETEANIVYIGGSITMGASSSGDGYRWVDLVHEGLQTKFPEITMNKYNVGIGGTGSNYGMLRLQRDVISKDPDMVFVEFAVNDSDASVEDPVRYMESIVLSLKALAKVPYVVFVYTTNNTLETDYTLHNQVAEKYAIPTIDLKAAIQADTTITDPKTLFADGVHPNDDGHAFYAKTINAALESNSMYVTPSDSEGTLSPYSAPYEGVFTSFANNDALTVSDGWTVDERGLLTASEAGETIEGTFTGNTFGVIDYYDPEGGKYAIEIDGKPYTSIEGTYWSTTTRQQTLNYVDFDLGEGEHTFKITVMGESASRNGVSSTGTAVYLKEFATNAKEGVVVPDNTKSAFDAAGLNGFNYDGYSTDTIDSYQHLTPNADGYIERGQKGRWMVWENVDFGSKGIATVTANSSFKGTQNEDANELFVRIDDPEGMQIAAIQTGANGYWYDPASPYTGTIETNVTGVHDVYVIWEGSTVGNVKSIVFTEATEYVAPVLYASEVLPASLGTVENASIIDGVADEVKENGYLKFTDVIFEDTAYQVVNAEIASPVGGGAVKVAVGEIGNVVGEITIEATGSWDTFTSQSVVLAEKLTTNVTQDVYLIFDADWACAVKSVSFGEVKTADENFDILDYDDITDTLIPNENGWIGNSYGGKWVKYASRDFGENQAWDVSLNYSLADNPIYGGEIHIRLDDPKSTPVATIVTTGTGSWENNFVDSDAVTLNEFVSGVHDIYICFTRTGLGNIADITFTKNDTAAVLVKDLDDGAKISWDVTKTDYEGITFTVASYNEEGTKLTDIKNVYLDKANYKDIATMELSGLTVSENGTVKSFSWEGNGMKPVTVDNK